MKASGETPAPSPLEHDAALKILLVLRIMMTQAALHWMYTNSLLLNKT
jgi:hypothetical protein